MKTIALRFSDSYAPSEGTIKLHNDVINKSGYVWYGKFGNAVSIKMKNELLANANPRFLLIKSGGIDRYWVYFDDIKEEILDIDNIPEYYRDDRTKVKTWFKVNKIVKAKNDVMSKCCVSSTGQVLSLASKYSMSPYFIIEYKEGEEI